MIYYLIILILFLFVVFNEVRLTQFQKFSFFLAVTFILVVFAGLRGDIEGDYAAYKDIFETSVNKFSFQTEPLYFFFNKMIISIGLPFQVVIFVMATVSIIPKCYFFYKNSLNFSFSVLVYYCTSYFIFDFIQIRQAVAIAIFIVSLKYIYEEKLVKYILLILLAALIHISALMLIPVYFFSNKKYSTKILYSVVGICAVINIMKITVPLMSTLLEVIPIPAFSEAKLIFYARSIDFSAVSIKQLVLGTLFIYIRDKDFKETKYLNILVNLFVVGILLTTILNGVSELAFRVKWYFFWAESILVVNLVYYFGLKQLPLKYALYLILAILYIVSLDTMLNEFASRGPYIFPYKTEIDFY